VRPEYYYEHFCGTAPTHHLYGLRTALDMLVAEEGLEAAWARHERFACAIWAAVEHWGRGGALALNVADPAFRSHAVTTIRTGPGEAGRLRDWCETVAGLTLGIALCPPGEDPAGLYRIGHMGHLNPPMVLGGLATIEAGLAALGIPHAPGGVTAATAVIAAVGGSAPEPFSSTNVVEQVEETH
jgi:alanine-glyoxylate transaminase/serine-glyoxylate transaminase/serine-pyruvate transaminase